MNAGTGKLGRLAKAAQPGVERAPEPIESRFERAWPSHRMPWIDRRILAKLLQYLYAGLLNSRAVVAPRLAQAFENHAKPRTAEAVVRRKIRAAEKRLAVRREPDRHRPTSAAGRRLHEQHVDAVDVGPFLAVDFDRHEVFVHHPRDLVVFKRLALHHMAPMTGRITDRQEERLILARGPLEGFLAPRIPVHGIVSVLEQVGTLLASEAIGRHSFL